MGEWNVSSEKGPLAKSVWNFCIAHPLLQFSIKWGYLFNSAFPKHLTREHFLLRTSCSKVVGNMNPTAFATSKASPCHFHLSSIAMPSEWSSAYKRPLTSTDSTCLGSCLCCPIEFSQNSLEG